MRAFMSVPSHVENPFARQRAAWAADVLAVKGQPLGELAALQEVEAILLHSEPRQTWPANPTDTIGAFWSHIPAGELGRGGGYHAALTEALTAFIEGE